MTGTDVTTRPVASGIVVPIGVTATMPASTDAMRCGTVENKVARIVGRFVNGFATAVEKTRRWTTCGERHEKTKNGFVASAA